MFKKTNPNKLTIIIYNNKAISITTKGENARLLNKSIFNNSKGCVVLTMDLPLCDDLTSFLFDKHHTTYSCCNLFLTSPLPNTSCNLDN